MIQYLNVHVRFLATLFLTCPVFPNCEYSPGGHGCCVDFPDNKLLTTGLELMLQAGKVVGSVCHGPMSFVGLKGPDGQPAVKGRKVQTCMSVLAWRA